MRTPGQFQQNYPRELAISEAAALAVRTPFNSASTMQRRARYRRAEGGARRFRLGHTAIAAAGCRIERDRRLCAAAEFHSCSDGTYWACVCQIAVTPVTGAIAVEKYTMAVDPGIVINPMQSEAPGEGGAIMGISNALLEEVTFDESGVTRRLDELSHPHNGGRS